MLDVRMLQTTEVIGFATRCRRILPAAGGQAAGRVQLPGAAAERLSKGSPLYKTVERRDRAPRVLLLTKCHWCLEASHVVSWRGCCRCGCGSWTAPSS